jgi:altronate hydrolase
LKIATNTPLAVKKKHWIDFDAGCLLDGADRNERASALFADCLSVAEGKETKGELGGYADIAIFKDGVTL